MLFFNFFKCYFFGWVREEQLEAGASMQVGFRSGLDATIYINKASGGESPGVR